MDLERYVHLVRAWLLLACLKSASISYGFPVLSASSHPFYRGWHRWSQWRHDDLPSSFKRAESIHFLTGECPGATTHSQVVLSLVLQSEWSLSHPKQASPPHCLKPNPCGHLTCSYNLFVISITSPKYNWNCSLFTEQTREEMTCFYGAVV